MRILQGIPPVFFILWALGALAATQHAYGENSYADLQRQVVKQRYEAEEQAWQRKMDQERAVFDESERIYEQSERDLWRQEDHPEIYGQP